MTTLVDAQGDWASGVRVRAAGRDLVRAADGRVRAEADAFAFDLDAGDRILPLDGEPTLPEVLRGRSARHGLRKLVATLRAEGAAAALGPAGGLCDALLDDVPGLLVVGGYGRLYDHVAAAPAQRVPGPAAQVCVGFHELAASGAEYTSTRFLSKDASVDFVPADRLAWHRDADLPIGAVRRRRLLEVRPAAGVVDVSGYFRDTFHRPDGVEVVIHEYGLSARLRAADLVVEVLEAHPGRLPMEYCPLAAAGTEAVIGSPVSVLDRVVRGSLYGPRSCTHLNDELRSLRLVPVLLAALDS